MASPTLISFILLLTLMCLQSHATAYLQDDSLSGEEDSSFHLSKRFKKPQLDAENTIDGRKKGKSKSLSQEKKAKDSMKDGNGEDYLCLKEKLEIQGSKICFNETVEILSRNSSVELFYEAGAYRGDPVNNFRLSLVDIHLFVRENYADLIERVGKNIFPLLVATDSEPEYSGIGGVWKIYFRNGTMRRFAPVGPDFEIYKCLSHMVLGVYTVIGPYFNAPQSISWKPKLQEMDDKITAVLHVLPQSGMSKEEQKNATKMLQITSNYINQCLTSNKVLRSEYEAFSTKLAPLINMGMEKASKAHVAATIPALKQLKQDLGPADWARMFVIIPTVWPVSLYDLRMQMLQQVMDYKQMNEQVLIAEGAKSEDDAKTTLGRIINDRAIAQIVFGGIKTETMKDHIFSLSTKRDLLSSADAQATDEYCKGELEPIPAGSDPDPTDCPMAKYYVSMLK